MTQPASQTSEPNRREFLKSSSVVAVGAGVLGSLGSLPRAHAAGDDTIKIGLVGCGGRGTGAAGQAISTSGKVKLIAMGDAFADRLQNSLSELKKTPELQDKHDRIDVPPERQFVGFDAYQKVLDSGIDLVVLATPPGFRPIHFEAAVKAGKHVFMEKPVAVDPSGVRQVLAAVEESKKKNLAVGVGLQRHHDPRYIETIQRLRDGAIGDIHTARVYWNDRGVWVHHRKPEETEMEYQMRNWYYFNWLCGDHICEQHIHNLDVINWLKDSHPVRAEGQGGRQWRAGKEYGEIYDHHYVEFEYADGTRMFSQCRHMENCWSNVSEHVQGTKGLANIGDGVIKSGKDENSKKEEWRYKGRGVNPYQVEHDDLFASIRAGKPINEGEYGATSSMTAILGRLCTYSGKMIAWDDALKSEISLQPKEYSFHANPPIMPKDDGSYAVAIPGQSRVV